MGEWITIPSYNKAQLVTSVVRNRKPTVGGRERRTMRNIVIRHACASNNVNLHIYCTSSLTVLPNGSLIDRQTGRQAGRQADGQTDRWTDRQTDI